LDIRGPVGLLLRVDHRGCVIAELLDGGLVLIAQAGLGGLASHGGGDDERDDSEWQVALHDAFLSQGWRNASTRQPASCDSG
jgi:hypothetical protein